MLPDDAGRWLLPIARHALAERLEMSFPQPDTSPHWLADDGASFVTLTKAGQLRGCIGSLVAREPLEVDVRHNARAAAFSDRRFPPLEASEFDDVRVEVSVLTAPEPLQFGDRADAIGQLRPGVDGVIVSQGPRRATFLPQVWEQLPYVDDFLGQLARKAGIALTGDRWPADLRLDTYQAEKWSE